MQTIPLGLYIHLPWCERKCPYCDFNSHEARNIPEMDYVDALLRDLDIDRKLAGDRPVSSLFIGGGTPSLFSGRAIARLLAGIGSLVELSPSLEASMEANPGSAEAEKFTAFREAGINRLSLGVQSFDDVQLQALGRVHNSDQARAAVSHALDAGFDSINIDLMHGLPGQTAASAEADLRAALAFGPPHLSWYQLTIEPNTVFHKRPPPLPVEDALAEIQEAGECILASAGYRQYEVSAYSREGFRCRHNLNYWSFGDYLGIGAGAHGKITFADGRIQRYAKKRQPADYMAAAGETFTARRHELSANDRSGEFMLNALRLREGFSMTRFSARTGLDPAAISATVQDLMQRGLLESAGAQIRASELGRRFLDTVIAEFFPER
ncbi:MAG: radical SAM family heme chaperone HemW [Halieaceae bacterium]|jgi:oxygen-independent coproporphyrinogen-3 oxidase|nr:radical SAM family heme chaperone HemW [Halieaceae bacterium]